MFFHTLRCLKKEDVQGMNYVLKCKYYTFHAKKHTLRLLFSVQVFSNILEIVIKKMRTDLLFNIRGSSYLKKKPSAFYEFQIKGTSARPGGKSSIFFTKNNEFRVKRFILESILPRYEHYLIKW